jgi:hypothetical protein
MFSQNLDLIEHKQWLDTGSSGPLVFFILSKGCLKDKQ